MNRGRPAVCIGYVENTTQQYKIYAPDMHSVITSARVEFDEDKKFGPIAELKLPEKAVMLTQNFNEVPVRNPRGRPKKLDLFKGSGSTTSWGRNGGSATQIPSERSIRNAERP